jgi:hypothetical protein
VIAGVVGLALVLALTAIFWRRANENVTSTKDASATTPAVPADLPTRPAAAPAAAGVPATTPVPKRVDPLVERQLDRVAEPQREALARSSPPSLPEPATANVAPPPAPAPDAPVPRIEAAPVAEPAAIPAPAVPAAAPPDTAVTPAPVVVPPPTGVALEQERAGIMRALNRYQDAYRERSVKALQSIYPSIPREARQKLDRTFKECRAYDVSLLNPQLALGADDPTSATVTTRSTYTCQPRSAQGAEAVSGQEVFLLRKYGDAWLVDRAMLDTTVRR